jgi:hypothetical protein
MAEAGESGFEFVMQYPNERFSRQTQTKIRRRAMLAVGAARHGPKPIQFETSKRRPQHTIDLGHPLPPMPLSGLELLVRDSGLDPVDFSALASIHIGAMSVSAIFVVLMLKLTFGFTEPRPYSHQHLIGFQAYCCVAKNHTFLSSRLDLDTLQSWMMHFAVFSP